MSLTGSARPPSARPNSLPPITAGRRRALLVLYDQTSNALTGHIGRTGSLQLRDGAPADRQVLQRRTLTRKRARDPLELDHDRLPGISQNPEKNLVLRSLPRLTLNRDAQAVVENDLALHQHHDPRACSWSTIAQMGGPATAASTPTPGGAVVASAAGPMAIHVRQDWWNCANRRVCAEAAATCGRRSRAERETVDLGRRRRRSDHPGTGEVRRLPVPAASGAESEPIVREIA
jgi:hypothetical protein